MARLDSRRSFRNLARVAPALVLIVAVTAGAHPTIDASLDDLARKEAKHPADPSVHLERARLQRERRQWDAALASYDLAALHDADSRAVGLGRAEVFLESGQPETAKKVLDRILVADDDPTALRLRARAWEDLGRPAEAAADLHRAMGLSGDPTPGDYLRRARLQAATGRSDAALRGLDEGLARLGAVPVLELAAVNIDAGRGDYRKALQRLDLLLRTSPRQPHWLVRRAELLQLDGQYTEARLAFGAALNAVESLPPARRRTAAALRLEQRCRGALEPTLQDAGSVRK